MEIFDLIRRLVSGSNLAPSSSSSPVEELQLRKFTIKELELLTNHFHPDFLIGSGGSGSVYRGTIKGTNHVAIKVLKSEFMDGDDQFKTEFQMLSMFKHENVVPLLGYCKNVRERILVYEYMPRGSVSDHLHKANPTLSWELRLKIALGAARGLAYLHQQHGIIHRDVKTSNILLNENWVAKISDLGISRMTLAMEYSHVTTQVVGTAGYLDPEYYVTSQLRPVSDVYAFGVVLLELLSGRRPVGHDIEFPYLVTWARECIRDGRIDRLIDQNLEGQISPDCLMVFGEIVARCIRVSGQGRPEMADVVAKLELALSIQQLNGGVREDAENDWEVKGDAEDPDFITANGESVNGHGSTIETSMLSNHESSLQGSKVGLRYRERNATVTMIRLTNNVVRGLQQIWEAKIWKLTVKEEIKLLVKQSCRQFSLAEIISATNNFSDALVIGKGGFGKIYKGLINNGQETVAIKRLNPKSRQGLNEYTTEIEILSDLRHFNIITLVGYCHQLGEKILLYEYMSRGSLADHFRTQGEDGKSTSLPWEKLLEICIGVGRGLEYLHTGRGIIHRDIKASNILLDENFEAKISDFGLAKHDDRNNKLENHVSTKVKGTPGYFDPDYTRTCRLTRKSDTYSFGVVLLEALSGRPAVDRRLGVPEDERILTTWARDHIRNGDVRRIISAPLSGEILPESLKAYVEIVERCLEDEPKGRPTMSEIVTQLEFALHQQKKEITHDPTSLSLSSGQLTKSSEEGLNFMPPKEDQTCSTRPRSSTDVQKVRPSYEEQTNRKMHDADVTRGKEGRKTIKHKVSRIWQCIICGNN